jgi:type IV pilus assembly protein PilC
MEWLLFSWPTLILLGLGLRMALRLTYGARGAEPGDPVHVFLTITSWVLIALGVAPAVAAAVFTFFGVIIGVLAAATFVEAVVQRRIAQRRSMCRMLSLLVERGGRLETSLLFAGQTIRGAVGRAAQRLFDAVSSGTPLGAAVVRYPAALPREAAAYLAAGSTRDARLAALRELSRSEQGELATIWRACVDRISYLASVLVLMAAVSTFVMMKIVPEYVKIFDEFQLELPPMTQLAVILSEFVVYYLAAPIFFAFVLLTLAAAVTSICYLCDVPVLKGVSDRLFRGRRTADILRILAIATEHRESLADALNRMARVYPSVLIRRQLDSAMNSVAAGADWRDALLKARVITRAEHGLLKTAEQVGNLPWALRAIANRREKRAVYRLAIALQVLYPLTILLLGAFVGFYAVALFIPIVQLIQGLA